LPAPSKAHNPFRTVTTHNTTVKNKSLNPITTWLLAIVAFLTLGTQYAMEKGVKFVTGLTTMPVCAANEIASELQLDLVLESAMIAFKQILHPLALFSTAFYDVPLEGTDIVQVPYYPLETAASKDFDGSYVFDKGTNTLSKPVTINKRKYQPLSFTSAEKRRQPKFDPEILGQLKGAKLAEDVLVDILSVVTAANFPTVGFTGAASDFDVDDVIDLDVAVTEAKWPVQGRGIITKPAYLGGLAKDMNSAGGMATFERDANGGVINFPTLAGFSFGPSNVIPSNGENLTGMVVYRSAILVGFSPIEPVAEVMSKLNRYEVVTDEITGLTLEYREWGDPDTDTAKRTIECNYGYAKGEVAALQRIRSGA
jgi:hypothetical protein